jgi:hypothetical protein
MLLPSPDPFLRYESVMITGFQHVEMIQYFFDDMRLMMKAQGKPDQAQALIQEARNKFKAALSYDSGYERAKILQN